MSLRRLSDPIEIAGIRIKNRIVMAPMGANYENVDGSVSDSLVDYFAARAEGGVGLIISPFTMVNAEQRAATLAVFSDRYIPGLNRLCERVQACGARFLLQIAHPGGKVMRSITGRVPVAPSGFRSPIYWERPRQLKAGEIAELVQQFVEAARRAQEAGCDGVEVHGAHTYLIGQFVSPHCNRRDDEYGGDFQRRMKFPSEIVRGIRTACGQGFIVGFKFSGHEELDRGVDEPLAKRIAAHMEQEGVDYVHVAATSSIPGLLEVSSEYPSDPPIYSPPGVLIRLAEAVKSVVGVPVVGTGGVCDPEYAEQILREARVDLVAVGRGLIADPDWAEKALSGRSFRCCIKCNICHKRLWMKKRLKCTVNPEVGQERTFAIWRAPVRKKVLVVGAGPAGMEAALVAHRRGHQVVLFEEKARVGGKMVPGSIPWFKTEIGKLLHDYEENLRESQVELRLRHPVRGSEELLAELPDAIILAAGSDLVMPPIEGIDRENVLTVLQLFGDQRSRADGTRRGEPPLPSAHFPAGSDRRAEVLIIGAGLVGCETGWYLADRGMVVKLVDVLGEEELLADEHPTNRTTLLRSLQERGVQILTRRKVAKIESDGVALESTDGRHERVPVQTVVLATGFKPRLELQAALREVQTRLPVTLVGDCLKPRKLFEAIHEGHRAGWEV